MKVLTNIGIYPTDKVEVQQTIQQVLNDVLQTLLKHVNLEAVYCFGFESNCHSIQNMVIEGNCENHQHWQINLLLIGENIPSHSSANLADIVYQQSKGEIGLILLCYSLKEIAKSNNEHKHLFDKIIRSGWLIYGEPPELARLKLDNLPDLDYKGIITYTRNRLGIAEGLLENVQLFIDQPLVAAYMLRNTIEQLCLGILYAFINYHPNQFNVQYLFQLCKSCCGLPASVFPDSLFHQERFKRQLKTSASDLRFRSTDRFSKKEVQLFYQNVLSFKEQVAPILQERISQLKFQNP
ncbi:hypothetical protein GCM10007103_09770 [Salinimicrobium marinum]|uniref:Uncharacterized protein n=1 Tax=Salinimicrobium marinum TaxID=680283 RepID=A0A918SBH0_9FLAO|nr:hypothetical protein [Salinimicrobium marinum]GHA30436.1 hypothetical protein GCM10007103_09770 [Salinimicrobium marinum]